MQIAIRSSSRPWLGLLGMLVATFLFSGCGQMDFVSRDDGPLDQLNGANAAQASCQVVIESTRGKPRVESVPLTGPLTVEDALRQTNATRAFRSIEVEVVRRVPESNEVLKMPVTYDSRNRHVVITENYALLPNDRIMVRRGQTSALSDLVDTFVR